MQLSKLPHLEKITLIIDLSRALTTELDVIEAAQKVLAASSHPSTCLDIVLIMADSTTTIFGYN
jgi:hypothetical protein